MSSSACWRARHAFVSGSPILVEAVAGLALLNAFGAALHNALADASEREAALATFLVSASGVGYLRHRRRLLGAARRRRGAVLTRAHAGAGSDERLGA